jgi:hypothetical protein
MIVKKVRCNTDIQSAYTKKTITKSKWYDVLWSNEYGFTFKSDSGDILLGRFKNCALINNNWETI